MACGDGLGFVNSSELFATDACGNNDSFGFGGNGTDVEGVTHGKEVSKYIVTFVFVVIFITGSCGNVLLIFTVIRNLSMRNSPNIFLANMAVGDLLIVVISVPFAAIIYVTATWPFGVVLCKFNAMLQDISIGVSIFTLLILSIDRYTAIVTPFKLHNKRQSFVMPIHAKILAIWVISIFLSIPDALNTSLERIEMKNSTEESVVYYVCSPYPESMGHTYHITVILGKFMIYFFIPVIIIVSVYGLMARQLIFSAHFLPSTAQCNQQQLQKQMKTRKSLAKVFLVMVLLFIVCFLPKHIFLIWFYSDEDNPEQYGLGWHIFKIIAHCLAYSNSCINPLTLYFLSKVFRKYFNRYLFRKCINAENEWPLRLRRNSQTQFSMPSLDHFPLTERRRSGNCSVYSTKNTTFASTCGRSNYL